MIRPYLEIDNIARSVTVYKRKACYKLSGRAEFPRTLLLKLSEKVF